MSLMSPLGRVERSDSQYEVGGLQFLTLSSAALGGRGDVTLFVPPESEGLSSVPLIILLHGVHSSHWAWAFKGGVHRTAARLIAAGELPPAVLATPSDGLWAEGGGYLPQAGADYERWTVQDVIQCVTASLPQLSAASPGFIAGFSMGGWGAMRLGAQHARLFSGVSAHSSVTTLDAYDALLIRTPTYATDEERTALGWLTRTPHLPPLRFDCGSADKSLADNRQLHQALLSAGVAHDYAEFPGGHTWAYWSQHAQETLRFFGNLARRPA